MKSEIKIQAVRGGLWTLLLLWSTLNGCIAQVPEGKTLLKDGISSFALYGASHGDSVTQVVPVLGQTFSQAIRVNTYRKTGQGGAGFSAGLTSPLKKGDVLWISFKARSIASSRETGESFVELRLDQLVNGKYAWPPYLERGISFGKNWTETSIPFVITKDVPIENTKLVLTFDTYPQKFEIGPVTFINCGPGVTLSNLPRTVIRYEGGEADAPWRKDAAERIEKYRKGDLIIKVLDAKGKPIKDAEVSVRMKRNAFNWGTATSSQRLLDEKNPESKMYRDTLLKYFNQVVFENEMKWGPWSQQNPQERGVKTKEANNWLKKNGITARGHVLVWPSWEHSPRFLAKHKNDPAIIADSISKHIEEQTRVMQGQFTEWDVINEPYAHNDFLKMLGRDYMVKWFNLTRKNASDVKLFLNDYTMFHGKGEGSASQTFYDNVKFLIDNGAPIDAIGEQGHIGGTPPGIPQVLERLDYFAKLGLPIQISEFDINSNDDDLKARYTRDFMTALYSHPATIGFVQWGFWEGQHWFPVAALWNKDWTVRENGKVYSELVTKTWWTNAEGKTSKDGTCKVRGFCGDYDVVVNYHGKRNQQTYTLKNQGGELVITL